MAAYKEVAILRRRTRCESTILAALILAGLGCLVAGIVLMVQANMKKAISQCSSSPKTRSLKEGDCTFSSEAKRSGLEKFLREVHERYYELLPHKIAFKPGVTSAEIRHRYKTYDSSPMHIKFVTDEVNKLSQKLATMDVNTDGLTLREKRAKAQLSQWMQHIFPYGVPFAYDYYAGDWMMGPNVFCWSSIGFVPMDVEKALPHFRPSTVQEMENFKDKLAEINQTLAQYVENSRLGVSAGMVRTVEECKAGLHGLREVFKDVAIHGAEGILSAWYMKAVLDDDFLSDMTEKEEKQWKTIHGNFVNESLRQFVIEYVGKPIQQVLRYFEEDHLQFCAPSHLSSGLAGLPLDYVFVNGQRTNQTTTKTLPTGELLDGKATYLKLLRYFTTTDKSPDEIFRLGWSIIDRLYPEVLKLVRDLTHESDSSRAKEKFMKILNTTALFYNTKKIPRNESEDIAYRQCSSVEGAMTNCPVRWDTMQNWFAHAREIMATLDPKTINLFHFTGPYQSTPNCPVELVPNFNPSVAAPTFKESDLRCSSPPVYSIPFFLEKPGPKNEEWTINAHEAKPGHLTQSQGYVEHFRDSCSDPIAWIQQSTFYLAFAEGWGLYAENPLISKYTDAYNDKPLNKYGMLKWQIWRALRLVVDTGLHFKGKSRDWALKVFEDYAWDTSDKVVKEVTRYQSIPGQAVTYTLGQMAIIELEEEARRSLGTKFSMKDFHFQVLRRGPSPLTYLKESIQKYITCVTADQAQPGCDEILRPPQAPSDTRSTEVFPQPQVHHSFKIF